ncbi:MAG TPA: hypothetical protein DER23_09585 [Clostridiales bacterium]|jgi:AraC-like DNA-binding protein|nr:hypothetical protein [Clostridiales bacterium]HCG36578.1 hypothetical protein [Clostridiales bacterium]
MQLKPFLLDCYITDISAGEVIRKRGTFGLSHTTKREYDTFLYLKEGELRLLNKQEKEYFRVYSKQCVYVPYGIYCGSLYSHMENHVLMVAFRVMQNNVPYPLTDTPFMFEPTEGFEKSICSLISAPLSEERIFRQRELVYRLFQQVYTPENRYENEGKYTLIAPGVKILVENFNENIPISALADHCAVSESYFRRVFKSYFGENPLSYRNRLRLQSAHELIISGLVTAAEASRRAGFSDPCYFSRLYKKYRTDEKKKSDQ